MTVVLIEGHEVHRHIAVYDVGNEVGFTSYAKGSCKIVGAGGGGGYSTMPCVPAESTVRAVKE